MKNKKQRKKIIKNLVKMGTRNDYTRYRNNLNSNRYKYFKNDNIHSDVEIFGSTVMYVDVFNPSVLVEVSTSNFGNKKIIKCNRLTGEIISTTIINSYGERIK